MLWAVTCKSNTHAHTQRKHHWYMYVCGCMLSSLLFRWNNRQNVFRLYSDPEVDPFELADTHTHRITKTHAPQHRTHKSSFPWLSWSTGVWMCMCMTDSQPNYLYGMINTISIDRQNYSLCVCACDLNSHACVAIRGTTEKKQRKTHISTVTTWLHQLCVFVCVVLQSMALNNSGLLHAALVLCVYGCLCDCACMCVCVTGFP